MYKNPGVSLRSFIIANCFNDEFVEVDLVTFGTIRECVEFNTDRKITEKINDLLSERFNSLLMLLKSENRSGVKNKLIKLVSACVESHNNVTKTYKDLLGENDTEEINLMTLSALYYKQALIDFKKLIDQLEEMINNEAPVKEPA